MIEKMKFISITGPKGDIDRIANLYLNKHEIHLENALTQLNQVKDIRPFVEPNPYRELVNQSAALVKHLDSTPLDLPVDLSIDKACNIIRDEYSMVEELNSKIKSLKEKRNHMLDLQKQIEHFRLLNYDLRKIMHFQFIKYRFGRIAHDFFDKFSNYIYDNVNTVFYECNRDEDYIWGVYFVPSSNVDEVDAIFSSLHFEQIHLPDEYSGTPEEAFQTIVSSVDHLNTSIHSVYDKINKRLENHASLIISSHELISELSDNFEIRKMAALTFNNGSLHPFYILCGWMSQTDCTTFLKETNDDPDIIVITDDTQPNELPIKPPTKLKNPKLFRPFEMFVKMYGLPAYNEIDPTIFVAITYSFIFGSMFGDIGQGLCLVVGGYLLMRIKKMNIAAIVSLAGIFSTIFGFLYGSFFGFEHVLKTYWLKPMDNVMTILIISVALGVVIILFSMILNIINAIRAKDPETLFFDSNGIAGLIFYGGVIASVIAILLGYSLPGTTALIVLLGLPLLAIFFKEPLNNLLEKKKSFHHTGLAMFFVEAFVELFDVVLTYATNTISFLRVGAFALSHAGMMSVVLMLAGAESTGSINWLIIVLGNILVAGMEGLIVGIQVLRLEYYEMFGRFYRGTGKEFKPFKENTNKYF